MSEHSDLFEVYALTANNQVDLLINQARKYMPEVVVIANERKYPELKEAVRKTCDQGMGGADAIARWCSRRPMICADGDGGLFRLATDDLGDQGGKGDRLANKETLVVAGELIMKLAPSIRCLSCRWTRNIRPFFNV